uniref:CCHC-type domain-containing protein n=1 Tax=Anopheles atroparvus TaxID=41427 RepID=A0A182IS66_ANOAO
MISAYYACKAEPERPQRLGRRERHCAEDFTKKEDEEDDRIGLRHRRRTDRGAVPEEPGRRGHGRRERRPDDESDAPTTKHDAPKEKVKRATETNEESDSEALIEKIQAKVSETKDKDVRRFLKLLIRHERDSAALKARFAAMEITMMEKEKSIERLITAMANITKKCDDLSERFFEQLRPHVEGLRTAIRSTGVVIELKMGTENLEALNKALSNAEEMCCTGVEAFYTAEEFCIDVEQQLNFTLEPSRFRMRQSRDGRQVAAFHVPLHRVEELLSKKIIVGWTANIAIQRSSWKPRCRKCLEIGHIEATCKGPDRKDRCLRCGMFRHMDGRQSTLRPSGGCVTNHRQRASQQQQRNICQWPRWNTKTFSREAFVEGLWWNGFSSEEHDARKMAKALTNACDLAMPRIRNTGRRRQVYWWTEAIANLRRDCGYIRRRLKPSSDSEEEPPEENSRSPGN